MFRPLLLSMCALPALGCFTKIVPPVDTALQGGTIMLPAPCGYTVTTVAGASAPVAQYHSLGADPTPKFVHVTVPNNASTTMALLWETNDNTTLATTVQYGTGTAMDQSVDGITFTYQVDTGAPLRMHETHLCGLSPDTSYTYRVGGTDATGKGVWSPTYTFRTAPDRATSPDAEVTFLNIGDTRDSYTTWGATLQLAFQKATPDFILFSGDAVFDGNLQEAWDAWFSAADPTIMASTPMLFAMGNHELGAVNFFSLFAFPGDEQNFSVDIGPAHVSIGNTSPVNPNDLDGAFTQLLDTNIKAGVGAPWNILVQHIPVWSAAAGPHPQDQTTVRMAWQPTIDMYKLDADFSGHDHNYERTKPMRGDTPGMTNADGTVYIVAGSAGAELYQNGSSFWTAYSESTYNFAIAQVRTGMMNITAYRSDGSTMDSTMLTK